MSKTFKRRKRVWDDEIDDKSRRSKRRFEENKTRRPKATTNKILDEFRIDYYDRQQNYSSPGTD